MPHDKGSNMNNNHYIIAIVIYVALAYFLALIGKPAELAGFTVVGALALVFLKLDSFKEFSGGGITAKLRDEVKSMGNDLEIIKLKETEPEIESEPEGLPQEILELKEKDPNAEKALLALHNAKWAWRSIGGVAKETSQKPSEALNTLELLKIAELAEEGRSRNGAKLWSPTVRGSVVGAIIENNKNNGA